jgi:starch synthase (maltosyl-transferring)
VIEAVTPQIDAGRFPAKRVVGQAVNVRAVIFTEGHDQLAGVLRFRPVGAEEWQATELVAQPNDRWEARFVPDRLGPWEYEIEAWVDSFGSWREALEKKARAGQRVDSELLEGAVLVRESAARAEDVDAAWLAQESRRLAEDAPAERRVQRALAPALRDAMARHADRSRSVCHPRLELDVERERARSGAWYEFFPRSCSPEPGRHGTFRDCEAMLEYVASMGFDVVYLPPIHPIGRSYRKGPNNTPEAGPGDPGSPWAIGSAEGGHDAVHPALGSLADFDRLVAKAASLGLEVALDLAFQCSPDHPWAKKHPEWFRRRPDGSIQYAENPPKKYQDIYPIHFECERWRELWEELKSVVLFWVGHGVQIFRVDNPHTKPFAFWEWLIREVRAEHPEVVFLSEAFTRPSVLQYLAKAGFSQSYGYFTWRNARWEIIEYFEELSRPPLSDMLRSNLFANTPDINPGFLQGAPRSAFQLRLTLAATLAGSYGIYGPVFELCVGDALPDSEEYLDSEKYQLRHWDLDRPESIRDFVTRINELRREHPALCRGDGPRFVDVDNPNLIAYSRSLDEPDQLLLVVVNLDPHHVQSGWLDLPLEEWGVDGSRPFQADDLLGGECFLWQGPRAYVSLNPAALPAHILRLRRHMRTEHDFDYFA